MSGIPLSSLNIHGEGFHFTVIEQDVKHQSGEAAWYPGNTRLRSRRTRPGSTLEARSPKPSFTKAALVTQREDLTSFPVSLVREREKETELGLELKRPDQSREWNFSAPSPGIRNRSHQKREDLSSSLKIKGKKKKSYTLVKNKGTKNTPSHRFSVLILGKTSLWR